LGIRPRRSWSWSGHEHEMKPKTTDHVFDFLDAVFWSAALGAAMELGLFWLLDERPLEGPAVARELGIPPRRCEYWLQILCSIGLLEESAEGYAPSALARAAILDAYSQETWAYIAGENRDRYPLIMNLPAHLAEPGSVWESLGLAEPDYVEQMAESPVRTERFTRMLYEIHLPLADVLAEALDMTGVERMLDLGGGSGVMSLALLRRHPELTSLVVDIPNVCVVGRQIAVENGMADRLSYLAADYVRDDLPAGFDLALECDAGPYDEAFFRKIRAVLNPGGRLVIVDKLAPAAGVAPPYYLTWAFQGSLFDPESTFTPVGEVVTALTRAGFQVLSESVLPPRGTVRWSAGWTVIEARA
jgi:ubiquinone/menaquinone biosynthesis C-methylase UbiE